MSEKCVYSKRIMTALTALNAVSDVIGPGRMSQIREAKYLVKWSAGAAAGQVVIEEAADPSDADTWAIIATVNWSAASKSDSIAVTGTGLAQRARIASAITTGTVTIDFVGN